MIIEFSLEKYKYMCDIRNENIYIKKYDNQLMIGFFIIIANDKIIWSDNENNFHYLEQNVRDIINIHFEKFKKLRAFL